MDLSCFGEMLKIKRKLIIAIILSLAVLSGCAQKENKKVHIFSAGSTSDTYRAPSSADESSSGTSSSASSAQSSSQISSPESSGEISETQPPVSSSESGSEEIVEAPENQTQTVVYNYDPKNSCEITFDGESIVVSGVRGDLFDGVAEGYPKMRISRSVENGILTCVLTPKTTGFDRRYGSFSILDKDSHINTVFIDLSNGKIMFPDTSALVQSNNRAVSNVVNTSEAKVAQYITLDGSSDRIPEILDTIKKISDEICAGIESNYEKLRAISRWVSDNIYYDHPIYNIGAPQYCLSLEYMLNNRSSICGGYSNMTSALCAAQGIRCLNITGMAINTGKSFLQDTVGSYHEWNVAEIDGRQVIVDSGWNSGKSISSSGTLSNKESCYTYFDIGEEVFSFDHKAQTAEYRDYWALVR